MNQKHLLISIFLLSIIFSSIFLLFFRDVGPVEHRITGTDYSSCYLPATKDLLLGKFVFLFNGNIRCAVGYPLVILPAVVASDVTGINALDIMLAYNVLMSALGTCFLFLLIKSVFNKNIAFISSLLWLSYPLNLWFIKNPNTEVPFILFLFIDLWIFFIAIKSKNSWLFLISGVLLGFDVLIRPIAVFLIIFLFIPIFILTKKGKKLISSLALSAGFLLIIIPWILAASFATGHFVLVSSIGSSTFVDGMSFGLKEGPHGDKVLVSEEIKMIMEDAQEKKDVGETGVLKFFLSEAQKRPVALFELLMLKSARSWYATSELWMEKEIALIQFPYLICAIAGLVLVFKKHKEKIFGILPILLIILYFWIMTTTALSIVRYMIPIMGLVMIFSAVAVDKIFEKFKIYEKFSLNNNSLSQ